MRRSTRLLTTLAVAVTALGLAAPVQAGTAPVLAFTSSPSPAFGSVAVGSSLDGTFTLTDTGTSASAAIKVSLAPSGPFTIPAGGDKCTGVSLGWKKTCTITVRYTPAAAGASDSATLTASAKKPTLPATLNLTGSSPSALSQGCQALNDQSGFQEFLDFYFNAGEVVTLTAVSGTVSMYVAPGVQPTYTLVGTATAPDSVTYTVPSTDSYSFRSDGPDGSFAWSCA